MTKAACSAKWRQGWLILILLMAAGLRCYQFGAQSLWYDETVSAYLASQDLISLTRHTAGDIHPPLYYYLLHLWTRLAGNSEFALAFPSLIFGLLLVAMAYRLGSDLADRVVGLLAAGLTAISPFHVWYSQEVRMYTLGSFLGALTLYALVRLWERPETERGMRWPCSSLRSKAWIIWVLAAAAGLYTLYYFAFLLVFENLFALSYWLWLQRRSTRSPRNSLDRDLHARLVSWLSAQVAVLVLYLPWLPIFYRQATDPPVPPWRSFTGLWPVVRDSWSALTLGQSVKPEQVWPILLGVALLYSAALLPEREKMSARMPGAVVKLLLAGYTLIPVGLIFLLSYLTPLFHVRYVFLYSSTFSIMLAWGIWRAWQCEEWRWMLGRRGAVMLAAAALVGASAFSLHEFWTNPLYASDDYRSAVRYIVQRMGPDDAVLINAGYVYTAFLYYYRGPIAWRGRLSEYPDEGIPHGRGAVIVQTGTIDGPPNLGWGSPQSDFYAISQEATRAGLERLFRHHPRVWMLRAYDTVTDPNGFIRAWLEEHGLLLEDHVVTGEANARVQGWRTHREPRFTAPNVTYPTDVAFGDHVLRLLGWEGDLEVVPAGDELAVTLYWRWEAPPGSLEADTDYSVSVRLYDGQGRPWVQQDEKLGAPLYPTSRWITGEVMEQPLRLQVPLGVPPGAYSLEVIAYHSASGAPLAVSDPARSVEGNRLRLGTVQVTRPPAWPADAWPELGRSVRFSFGSELRLVRMSASAKSALPGDTLHFRFLWQARRRPRFDYQATLALLDSDGQAVAQSTWAPASGLYPTSAWQPGEVVLDQAALTISGAVLAGRYRISLGVQSPDGRWLGRRVILDDLELQSRPANYEIPPMQHRLNARLGEAIRLLGYDLSSQRLAPGDELVLTLYWQAIGGISESFKVFNHLVSPSGEIKGQRDGYPNEGRQPTPGWLPGEVIRDTYRIAVASDAPIGRYRLLTGMYRESDLSRLPAFDEQGRPIGDAILLAEVEVGQ
ncbi:MAG: glycosyltransferase family 39 protein [Anaerolineae bacterium]|nr:glycosyltransferase family 39 protein [Anaerolineae bacterium]MDW8098641.1 glycosyltransferase family 39 protein [Anaerolineae bacterium]